MTDKEPKTVPEFPVDDTPPIFDQGAEELPWRPDDALPMDDDGIILPGNDPLDEDPNDNGDHEGADPEDLPEGVGRRLDPNMRQSDLLP